MKRLLTLALLAALTAGNARAQLVVNELMQSNIDCIMDDLNDFPDSWVELYNTGDAPVNLKEYSIGLTARPDEAWALPTRTVPARGFIVVYCDKVGRGLHTSFRLESGKGGAVYLFHNGEVADHVTGLKKQPAPNIAYGRQTEGSDTWGYQATPTPGAQNCGQLCEQLLPEPVFSEPGHVVTDGASLTLSLTMPEGTPDGTTIRLTLDGSEPTEASQAYTAPLTISRSQVVRAKAFCDGWLSPRSTTHSYLFHPRELTLPVISVVTDNRYLNDQKIGIYVRGNYQPGRNNYDFNWRRPINLEYFEASGQPGELNQLCETRIAGGATRGNARKTLCIYANKRFGTKRFDYEFFPDQRPGVTDFKSLLLRNAGNDFDYLYMRDGIIQRTMAQHCDLDWQAWRPAIVYINGDYKGILNIRERSNEDNIYTHYDKLEDIDMVENWAELKEGTIDNFQAFKAFYAEEGHTLAEYAEWMDWEEFLNLMSMNLYYCNLDFPGNNFVMWRPRAEGGKWRFVAKDTDFGLGLYGVQANYRTLEWIYNPGYDWSHAWANQYDHTRLFRRLMDDADFHREFIDRTAVYMGDFMNERGTRDMWDPMYELIATEYPFHRQLINSGWPNYSSELTSAHNWLASRTDIFYTQLSSFFQLGLPVGMTVNPDMEADELQGISIKFNGVRLSEGKFDGKFFVDRDITLSSESAEGAQVVTGWKVDMLKGGAITTTEVDSPVYTFQMPRCQQLAVTAILGDASGIGTLPVRHWTWSHSGDELVLQGVERGTLVSLYDMQGMLVGQTRAAGADVRLPLASGTRFYIVRVGNETVKIN